MGKLTNSESGFSAIEALLILVVVGILGFTGWFVYHSQKAANEDYNSQPDTHVSTTKESSKVTDQYVGWKSTTFSGDNLTIKYPLGWQASSDSATGDALVQKTVGTGTLTVRLGWAADGLIANAGGDYGYKAVSKFTFNGKPAYIVSDSNKTGYYVSSCAAPKLCFFAPKTSSQYKGINEELQYMVPSAQQSPALPSDTTSLNEAKQIMSSLMR